MEYSVPLKCLLERFAFDKPKFIGGYAISKRRDNKDGVITVSRTLNHPFELLKQVIADNKAFVWKISR